MEFLPLLDTKVMEICFELRKEFERLDELNKPITVTNNGGSISTTNT